MLILLFSGGAVVNSKQIRCKMCSFGRLFLQTLNRRRSISLFSLRGCASICAGRFKTVHDFVGRSDLLPASRTCLGLGAPVPVSYDRPRCLCSLRKTQCDVHRFGKLQLAVGASCDVTVSALNPELYLDQNLALVTDAASRLSVNCKNSSDGISHVTVSESQDSKTTSHSQQSDVCHIHVPIKYGSS